MILFGGMDGTTTLNDTWAWDGSAWTQLTPANSPPPRARAGMTSKLLAPQQEIVLYGGHSAISGSSWGVLNDMWTFDGVDWEQVAKVVEVDAAQDVGPDEEDLGVAGDR